MLQIIVENSYGQQLDFSKTDYTVKATGLTPGTATVNTSKIAITDGAKFNSSSLNTRNIVLTIIPNNNIEQNRINIYKYIQLKKYVKMYFKNGSRNVWIEGYTESIEGDLYENPQQLQVSILCPNPCFKSIKISQTDFSTTEALFTFPFTTTSAGISISEIDSFAQKNIYNTSDEETGIIIELDAVDTALEPTIYNVTTGESFTINHEFIAGDIVRLNTRSGEKELTLIRNGVESNILNKMELGSDWFNLQPGDNIFSYTAVSGVENLHLTIILQPVFVGV